MQPDTLTVRRSSYAPRELSRWAALNLTHLPFETVLSLAPLIDFYRNAEDQPGQEGVALLARRVETYVARAPELAGPIEELALLREHRPFLDLLMTAVFPPVVRDRVVAAALVPFEFRSFYCTPPFEYFLTQEQGYISGRVNLDLRTFTYGKILSAYLHILQSIYGIDVPFEYPVVFTAPDPDTGLDRHFKVTMDLRFVRVEATGEVPPLAPAKRRELLNHLHDLSVWRGLFPGNSFRFSGFSILHASDVTDHRVVSLLENSLIDTDSVLSVKALPLIAERVRALLRAPRIELGLAAVEGGQMLMLNEPSPLHNGTRSPAHRYNLNELEGSVFRRCLDERAFIIVDDLNELAEATPMERQMLQAGARNLVAAPLTVADTAVGLLYLWAHEPGTLHALNVMKLQEVLPHLAAAVRRGLDTFRSRVQSVIMGEYTAIHPSVEWRFRQAALRFLQRQEAGLAPEVEPIVFDDVYPLFAATDIRGSSTHRNEAVRQDLLGHLERAEEILALAAGTRSLPFLHHLVARIRRYRAALEGGLTSGDETAIRDFLHQEVDPILSNLRQVDPALQQRVDDYVACADPETGSLYGRCRAFEESVARLNQTISTYLEAEQQKMQAFFPHYFEKHQTDGVSFSIYVGASLMENGTFDPTYVRVLRLWQLYAMCGIGRRVEPLRDAHEVSLETTHLVLVQHTPVTIRFRFDETRFDVDGAQHIRYEIMKQRVEKACLRDSDERLTQPEKIAIVYSQDREREEYARYVALLQEEGLLTDEVEDLELADLQGMKGLRAFRVRIDLDAPLERSELDPERLHEAILAMTD